MIRLRPLRPREKRSLRHWAIELAVVVVGVLLALWAAEWASARDERESDALAIAAMRNELMANVGDLATWRSLGACHGEQLEHIRDRLIEGGADWPGIDRRAVIVERAEGRIFGGFYILPTGIPTKVSWDAAVEAGVIGRMEPKLVSAYGGAFGRFESYAEQMMAVTDARKQIGALVFPGRLSDTDRFAALNALIVMDGAREYIDRQRGFFEFELTEDEIRQIEKRFDGWMEGLEQIGKVRPCYTRPQIPDIFVENDE